MDKRKKMGRFLKNRTWKSKLANRLKGNAEDVCQDYLRGTIDSNRPMHFSNSSYKETELRADHNLKQ